MGWLTRLSHFAAAIFPPGPEDALSAPWVFAIPFSAVANKPTRQLFHHLSSCRICFSVTTIIGRLP